MFGYELHPRNIEADLAYLNALALGLKKRNQKLHFVIIPCNPRNRASVDSMLAAQVLSQAIKTRKNLQHINMIPTLSCVAQSHTRALSQLKAIKYGNFSAVAIIGGEESGAIKGIDSISFIAMAREILGERVRLISGSNAHLENADIKARLVAKLQAGIDMIITQPIFDKDTAEAFLATFKRIAPHKKAMINAMAVFAPHHAKAMNEANLGFSVPDSYINRIELTPKKAFKALLKDFYHLSSHIFLSSIQPKDKILLKCL